MKGERRGDAPSFFEMSVCKNAKMQNLKKFFSVLFYCFLCSLYSVLFKKVKIQLGGDDSMEARSNKGVFCLGNPCFYALLTKIHLHQIIFVVYID